MPAQVYVSARTALHPAGSPIESVHVAIHETGGDFLQEGTTDAAGQVYLGNRAADTYEIRITPPKPGKVLNFKNRQSIVVVDSDDPVVFDVVVDTTTAPVSGDAILCRCSGLFVDDSKVAARGVTLRFTPTDYSPNVLLDTGSDTSYAVVGTQVSVTTDKTGYAVIDLVRTQRYRVQVSTYPNMSWDVLIPDLSSSSLPDVIFPKPQTVEYRDLDGVLLEPVASPVVLVTQGSYTYLNVEVIHRSGLRVKGLKGIGLQPDENYYMLGVSAKESGRIKITGKSPGAVVLSVVDPATEAPGYDVRVYPASFIGNLAVTVLDAPDIPDLPPPGVDPDDVVVPPIVVDGGEF